MATAGTAIAAVGVGWVGVSGYMLQNDDPRAGLGLGLVVNGAVALTVGIGLAIGGAQRARDPKAWLDRSPRRRARLEAAAGDFDPHLPTTIDEAAVVAKGHKLRNLGFMTFTAGVGLLGFGSALSGVYPSDSVAVRAVVPALSAPFIIAGSVLLAAGSKRIHHPDRYTPSKRSASRPRRVQLTAAPTFQRGGMGVSLSGRF
jgi:hypothetical protein